MAVKTIEIYPTCEIHLLIDHKTPMRIMVRDQGNRSTNLSGKERKIKGITKQKTECLNFDPKKVKINQQKSYIEFSPLATGYTIGRIRHTDTSVPTKQYVSEVLVRIYVHKKVADFWIGNNQATLFKDQSNYVLSVYAKFDDGTFGDISYHRYLKFTPSTPSDKNFVDVDVEGRLTGKKKTTSGAKRIDVKLGNIPRKVYVSVEEPLNTLKKYNLECVHGSGDVKTRRNILFLSEGFTQAQKPAFDVAVEHIRNRLMKSPTNSPYHLLQRKINIWRAFDPSPEAGVGAGHPIHTTDGTPLEPSITTDPAAASDYRLIQVKDSRFGLFYGSRYGDRRAQRVTGAAVNTWFLPQDPPEVLDIDRRRMAKDWDYLVFLDDYLSGLRVNPKRHKGAKYANVSATWKSTRERGDKYLVCFLVNDDFDGGSSSSEFYGVSVSVKQDQRFNNLALSGNKLDHTPNPIVPIRLPAFLGGRTLPDLAGTDINAVTSTIAHELAHAFGLGDEYEASASSPNKTLLETDADGRANVRKSPNLTHYWLVKDSAGKIDMAKVVWNKWMRIEQASILSAPAKNVAGNTKIEVAIDPNEALVWFIPPGFINRNAYLRTQKINFDQEPSKKYLEGPFKIENIDLNTGKITLKGKITKKFPENSVIYMAKERAGSPLPLIEPLVAQFIANTGQPFARKPPAQCNTANQDPSPAPAIPNLVAFDWQRQYIVGVYEGGGEFNCNVYRPCGQCRMRDVDTRTGSAFPPFCPVCKYYLVNSIYPENLPELEREYPLQEPAVP